MSGGPFIFQYDILQLALFDNLNICTVYAEQICLPISTDTIFVF